MSALSLLQHIIPVPKYMTLPNVGVDISDTSLKYIQFKRDNPTDKDLELYRWGDLEIPEGAVEGGTIQNISGVVDTLRQVKTVCGTDYVRVSLPEERAYLFETTIEKDTPFKEIRGLLEFKLEENVPLSPRDAYFDFDMIEGGNEDELLVSVAVYLKDTINSYYDACIGAGLVPLSFEIESQAIGRAAITRGNDDTHMIIDFGKTRTGIGIVYKGILMYTSTIDVGGKDLSDVMRTKLGEQPEDAYSKIKNEQGILSTEDNVVYDALLKKVNEIAEEIETRIQYWETRRGTDEERSVRKIILCGGSSNLAGLPEHLTEKLSIPVERADVWHNAFSVENFIPPITRRFSYGYATAIGLALTDFMYHD